MWQVKFLNEAKKDLAKLDNSLKGQVLKGIAKVRTNPLPVPHGYGKPLGNKGGNNLTGFFKIKYKGIKSSSDTEVEFKSIDDLYCALIRNGKTEFTIKKSKLNEFMDLFNIYVENPEKQGD